MESPGNNSTELPAVAAASAPAIIPLSPPPATEGASSSSASDATRRKRKRSASSRRETVILLLVVAFVLNSLNGRKIIDSVNSQFDYLANAYYFADPGAQEGPPPVNRTEDTAIVITSSSIPSHPSTYMVEMVLNSTVRLKGLSPTAPIFITVDHFRYWAFKDIPPELEEKIKKLEEYTINLYNRYLTDPRIHIIPGMKNNHIGGSVMKAMNLISVHYPSVKFMYYLQHDFYFITDVDHTGLAEAMDRHPDLNYVRFPKRAPHAFRRECGKAPVIEYNSTVDAPPGEGGNATTVVETHTSKLSPTPDYSDNNHFVRFEWYKALIKSMIKLTRPPEDPLQSRANNGCHGVGRKDDVHGLYLYHKLAIGHLDGRHRANTP